MPPGKGLASTRAAKKITPLPLNRMLHMPLREKEGEDTVGIPSFYFRNMLLQYDRQLVTARRLARIRPGTEAAPALAETEQQAEARQPGEDGETTAEAKRRIMVEHVARELLENLLFTGSDNPIVEEVRQELDQKLEGRYTFWYPPGEVDVRIVRESPEGRHELTSEERKEVLAALWDITLAKVDATML